MEEKKLCQCNHEGRKSFWGLFFRLFEIEDELSNWAYVIVRRSDSSIEIEIEIHTYTLNYEKDRIK